MKNDEIGNYLHAKISNIDEHPENVRELLISLEDGTSRNFYDFYIEDDPDTKNLYLVQDPRNLPLSGNENFRIKILILKKNFKKVFERVTKLKVRTLMFVERLLK